MENVRKPHLPWLDLWRGIAVVQMLAYHILYDYYVVCNRNPDWWQLKEVCLWQQEIVYNFIFIAGVSCYMAPAQKRLWQGLWLSIIGVCITLVTSNFFPSEAIYYGVITFMGWAYLICCTVKMFWANFEADYGQKSWMQWLNEHSCWALLMLVLCILTYDIRLGYYSVLGHELWQWPSWLYRYDLRLLGLPREPFYTADYVPIFPHIFAFGVGYFMAEGLKRSLPQALGAGSLFAGIRVLGNHSLLIYLVHQPILIGLMLLLK